MVLAAIRDNTAASALAHALSFMADWTWQHLERRGVLQWPIGSRADQRKVGRRRKSRLHSQTYLTFARLAVTGWVDVDEDSGRREVEVVICRHEWGDGCAVAIDADFCAVLEAFVAVRGKDCTR